MTPSSVAVAEMIRLARVEHYDVGLSVGWLHQDKTGEGRLVVRGVLASHSALRPIAARLNLNAQAICDTLQAFCNSISGTPEGRYTIVWVQPGGIAITHVRRDGTSVQEQLFRVPDQKGGE